MYATTATAATAAARPRVIIRVLKAEAATTQQQQSHSHYDAAHNSATHASELFHTSLLELPYSYTLLRMKALLQFGGAADGYLAVRCFLQGST